MRTIHYISILILLFLASCTPDDSLSSDEEQGNVTFLFTAGSEINTRTDLGKVGPKNQQHVEKVYLYIFKGTSDNATYADVREIDWPNPADVSHGTTQRSYTIGLAPDDYTFLAVGLDDQSGATYNLPSAIAAGTTLANAKATLASGQTTKEIARSELFAGWQNATIKASNNAVVTIDLWRRVAGVLGYFKNLPAEVQTIQVLLYEDQNTDIPLRKPTNNNTAEDTDFGTEVTGTTDGQILLSFDAEADWEFPEGGGTGLLGGLYRKGAYVLPKQAPTAASVTHTLTVRTLKKDGTIVRSYNVILRSSSDGATGGSITTPVDTKKFPLYANQLYSIGTEENPVDLGEEENDMVITVNPDWEVIEPTIPLE